MASDRVQKNVFNGLSDLRNFKFTVCNASLCYKRLNTPFKLYKDDVAMSLNITWNPSLIISRSMKETFKIQSKEMSLGIFYCSQHVEIVKINLPGDCYDVIYSHIAYALTCKQTAVKMFSFDSMMI